MTIRIFANIRKSVWQAGLVLIASIASPLTLAADLAIEEVIVTARKVQENLQTTPVAVSSFSEDELIIRDVGNLEDVGSFVPNVALGSSASVSGLSSAPNIFIRGIGQQDFVNTADPAVGVYLDGVYIGRSLGSLMDIVDIQRIDVLRGPQGTLFGRNNIGGAIDVVSKQPDPDAGPSGRIIAKIGEDEFFELQASGNIPISDTAAIRLSAMSRTRDGYVKALQYDDLMLGNDDSLVLQAKLRVLLSDTVTLDVAVDRSSEEEAPAPLVPTYIEDLPTFGAPTNGDGRVYNLQQGGACDTPQQRDTDPVCFGNSQVPTNDFASNSMWTDENGNPVNPDQEMDITGVSVTLNWDAPIGTFKSITAYREFDSSFYNDLDFSPFPIFHNSNIVFDQNQKSQELQLSGTALDDRLTFVGGLYYFEEESTQLVGINRYGGPPPIRPNPNGSFFQYSDREVENQSSAAYIQGSYSITDAVQLTLGFRYTKEEKDFALTLDRLDNNGTIFGPIFGQLETTEQTPLLTIGWEVSEATYTYFTYTEGFRSGGFPTRFTGGFPSEIEFYDPEYVDSYEIGLKTDVADGRLRFNVAAFRTEYTDIQVAASPVNPSDPGIGNTNIDNLADAEISGIEAEFSALLGDNFRLDLTAGWLSDELSDIKGGSLISNGIEITEDSQLPYMPELSGSLGLSYNAPLASGAAIIGRLDILYTDEQYFRIENIPEVYADAYTTANAQLSYENADSKWRATLGVRNLTDSDHFVRTGFADDAAYGRRARPRTFYISYRYDFGG